MAEQPKAVTNAGNCHLNVAFHADIQRVNWARGQTMTTFHRRPQFQAPIYKLSSARAAEREDDQMPTENLSELLGRVSENSTSQIDDLVGDFGRLREKLRTDGERIQREIEEYSRLSQQVMQLTKTISESVEKVRASVDRPQGEPQE
jgi:hypothetical protein